MIMKARIRNVANRAMSKAKRQIRSDFHKIERDIKSSMSELKREASNIASEVEDICDDFSHDLAKLKA